MVVKAQPPPVATVGNRLGWQRSAVNRQALQIAAGSLGIAFVVLGLKLVAYLVTGSVALFSDAMESVVNVAAAGGAIVAIYVSGMPADANHPYGHSKAEYFSAVAEGVLIIIAAGSILWQAYKGIISPPQLEAPGIGIAINLAATAVNAGWGLFLIRRGRQMRSPALVADGRHLMTDVITSLGVAAGLILAVATGITIIDPIAAALVAISVLWSGWQVVRQSISGLMDEVAPADEVARIQALIGKNAAGAIEAHDLRTRHAGHVTFIEFHLVVDGAMTVAQSHAICDRIEAAIRTEFEDARMTIHVEPEEKAKLHRDRSSA